MSENKLVELSMDLAVEIVNLCDSVKGHSSMTNQMLRSGTSVGANIHEANYAHGKADFIAKLQKEMNEVTATKNPILDDIYDKLSEQNTPEESNRNTNGRDNGFCS